LSPTRTTSSAESLWAFDSFGSVSAATASQSQGTQQQWYRLTSSNGFFNTQDGSAALWHDPATDKYWYIYAGGCRQEPITNVSRSANVFDHHLHAEHQRHLSLLTVRPSTSTQRECRFQLHRRTIHGYEYSWNHGGNADGYVLSSSAWRCQFNGWEPSSLAPRGFRQSTTEFASLMSPIPRSTARLQSVARSQARLGPRTRWTPPMYRPRRFHAREHLRGVHDGWRQPAEVPEQWLGRPISRLRS
jgi:hypothetical protein